MLIMLIMLLTMLCSCVTLTYAPETLLPEEAEDPGVFEEVAELDALPLTEETSEKAESEEELYEEQVKDITVSPYFLNDLMENRREIFGKMLDDPAEYEIQILFTQIFRNINNQPMFSSAAYQVDAKYYFYPASVVKMAIAALTLEKLNSLPHADRKCKLSVANNKNGSPGRSGSTVEKYIYNMIVYSDNIAYNKLYDFLGQEYINEALRAMGYEDCQIVRRFDSPTSAAMDRINYPWELRNEQGELVERCGAITNENIYTLRDRDDMDGLLRGKAYRSSSRGKISAPKEFYDYNYMSIEVMQQILKSLIFPLEVEDSARFVISMDDREFLLNCMKGHSTFHKYFIYGDDGEVEPNIEIYNKTGTSYGNIIDNAYIIDSENNIEFMLTAVIYVNPNGVIGDGSYSYEKTGIPFLKELGLAVLEELRKQNLLNKGISN
ncbi:MAG: class A beta-lactamase-related serine hydrolase [Clostridiales bacterium]|nr:class A beta-lactamase-related serine hydrolase [Clostridiales bacterium]